MKWRIVRGCCNVYGGRVWVANGCSGTYMLYEHTGARPLWTLYWRGHVAHTVQLVCGDLDMVRDCMQGFEDACMARGRKS